jgi:hypothetical protein
MANDTKKLADDNFVYLFGTMNQSSSLGWFTGRSTPRLFSSLFVSGKIVLTGPKMREEIYHIYTTFENIYPVLTEYRKRQFWQGEILLLFMEAHNFFGYLTWLPSVSINRDGKAIWIWDFEVGNVRNWRIGCKNFQRCTGLYVIWFIPQAVAEDEATLKV